MKTTTTFRLTIKGNTEATCRYSKRAQAWHMNSKTLGKRTMPDNAEAEATWNAYKEEIKAKLGVEPKAKKEKKAKAKKDTKGKAKADARVHQTVKEQVAA